MIDSTNVIETVKVQLRDLSSEAFRPYGHTTGQGPLFPDVTPGQGRAAVEVLTLTQKPLAPMRALAIHFSYNQTIIAIKGTMGLIVAPPPAHERQGDEAHEYKLDYERLAAFRLTPGQGVLLSKGTWHNLVPLGEECTYVNVTRKDPGEGSSEVFEPQHWLATGKQWRTYIEFVDLAKRDHREISVQL